MTIVNNSDNNSNSEVARIEGAAPGPPVGAAASWALKDILSDAFSKDAAFEKCQTDKYVGPGGLGGPTARFRGAQRRGPTQLRAGGSVA